MAAITFCSRCRTTQLREQLRTLLSAGRAVLDRFVSDRMRHAAAEADRSCARQSRSTPPGEGTDQIAASAARFVPLGPDVLSATIPAFFIGRNEAGLWVAREARGRVGGIFLLNSSALAFARAQSGTAGCATIFPSETIELDLANEGNRLAPLMAGVQLRIRQIAQSVTRLNHFDAL